MTIVKRRPHIIELLQIAIDQRRILNGTRLEILERPASIWLQSVNPHDPDSWKVKLHNRLITWSRLAEKVNTHRVTQTINLCMWPLAYAVVAYASPLQDNPSQTKTLQSMKQLDIIINVWYLLVTLSAICGTLIRIKIEKAFDRHINVSDQIMNASIIDFIIVAFCLGYGISNTGMWLRFCRLIIGTNISVKQFEQADILLSGISNGIKSISVTIIILFLLAMFFASLGHYCFKDNDPAHFGTYSLSVITFFQLSTFANWSDVYYINYYGCNEYPGQEYSGMVDPSLPVGYRLHTYLGQFMLPVCPPVSAGYPAVSTLIFTTYTVLNGYVILSMCLGVVAIGITEKLESIRTMNVYGETNGETMRPVNVPGNAKMSKLLGINKQTTLFKKMIERIWASNDPSRSISAGYNDSLFELDLKLVSKNVFYEFLMASIIALDASLQIVDEANGDSSTTHAFHVLFQVFLLVDVIICFIPYIPTPRKFFTGWNIFKAVLMVVIFVPTADPDNHSLQFLESLRLLRLATILQAFSRFIPDLAVIITAISSSFRCLCYVMFLIVLFLAYFAIAGVLLFKNAAPFYFGNTGVALRTVFQVMTLDNWTDIMRKTMYGCKFYGSFTGLQYDSYCDDNSLGMGYASPIFLFTLIIMTSMVLTSLFVGVVMTSIELLRDGVKEEALIWGRVNRIKLKYDIVHTSVIDMLLELFEKLDKDSNAELSFEDLTPLLDAIEMDHKKHLEFFHQVDVDRSGKIDFAEFTEMIMILGVQESVKLNKACSIKPRRAVSNSFMVTSVANDELVNSVRSISQSVSHKSSQNDKSVSLSMPSRYGVASNSSKVAVIDDNTKTDSSSNTATVAVVMPFIDRDSKTVDSSYDSNYNIYEQKMQLDTVETVEASTGSSDLAAMPVSDGPMVTVAGNDSVSIDKKRELYKTLTASSIHEDTLLIHEDDGTFDKDRLYFSSLVGDEEDDDVTATVVDDR